MTAAATTNTRIPSVKEFVSVLAKRPSEDMEKLLLHMLDTSANHWNAKATLYLNELKQDGLTEAQAEEINARYNEAFCNTQDILRMRYRISGKKRTD